MLLIRNFIFLIPIVVKFDYFTAADSTPCIENCTFGASAELLSTMTLNLYKTSYEDCIKVPINDPLELMSEIDNAKPTHVYIYGWLRILDPRSLIAVVEAYLKRKCCNIILLDYPKISNTGIIYAGNSAEGVSYYLARSLNKLYEAGLNVTGFTFVGHSLGGQLSGLAAKYLNFRLPRIIALDPGGPEFYVWRSGLNPNNAEFVVAIHSDRNLLGISVQVGHADFYLNGGFSPQPGCLSFDYCSHYRAVYCYVESLQNIDAFVGRECTTYLAFKVGTCNSDLKATMGYGTPSNTIGRYFLETNGKAPFARGERGATYQIKGNKIAGSKADAVTSLVE